MSGPPHPPAPSDRAGLLPVTYTPLEVDAPSSSSPPSASKAPRAGHHPPPPPTDSWIAGALHVTAAVIGVGVLGLPRAVADLGLAPGVVVLALFLALSLHTALLLARAPGPGTTYADLAAPLGPRAAAAVGASQLAACGGLSVAYTITAGASAAALLPGGATLWTVAFGAVQLPIAVAFPNFHALRGVSLVGTAASIYYVTAAAVTASASAAAGPPPPPVTGGSLLARVSAVGTVGFAFGGHYVVAGARESVKRAAMTPAVAASYAAVTLSYFSVAVSGVLAFGSAVADDVLLSRSADAPAAARWVVAAANAAVVLHVSAGLQLFSQAPFAAAAARLGPIAGRAAYCAAVTATAAALPFFGEVMALVGASLFLPATFVLPHVFHVAAGGAGAVEKAVSIALAAGMSAVSVAATVAAVIQLGGAAKTWWGA